MQVLAWYSFFIVGSTIYPACDWPNEHVHINVENGCTDYVNGWPRNFCQTCTLHAAFCFLGLLNAVLLKCHVTLDWVELLWAFWMSN